MSLPPFSGSVSVQSGRDFVENLLQQMTLAEKVGQMTQLTNTALQEEPDINPDGSPGDSVGLDAEVVVDLVKSHHVGSFLNGIAIPGSEWIEFIKELQGICIREHRLGIPMIYGIDHMHGSSYLEHGTIFPHRNNLGATFRPSHSFREGEVIGIETSHLGHHWVFAPVMDTGRNHRWPRFYETYSEDPFLCAKMGAAFVEGLQHHSQKTSWKQASCAKHYIGYSAPDSGWDRAPATISDYQLFNLFVPPFKAALDAGAQTIMVNGGEVNGVPVHASQFLLKEVLRDYLDFDGVVVTDWEDVIRLHTVHKVAPNPKEAVRIAIEAGIDMSMTPFDTDFADQLIELVESGEISEKRIDESVRRILKLKVDLGLFDSPVPTDQFLDQIGLAESKESARAAAVESIVLLKNGGALPISKSEPVFVGGPLAEMKRAISGGWTLRWIPARDDYFPEDMETVSSAIIRRLGAACSKLTTGIPDSHSKVVLVLGEEPYSEGSGNDYDARLDQSQISLIKETAETGASIILVILGGRPRIVTEVEPLCDAIVWAGLPGFEGAEAIASLLCGDENFSGKLPFSYPAQTGHFYHYNHKQFDLGHYQEFAPTLTHFRPFGYGLSYTTFEYSGLRLSAPELTPEGELTASVTISNTGTRAGSEAILWFISDEYASFTPPVRQLRHFDKVDLEAGESMEIHFTIQPKRDLGFFDDRGAHLVEEGAFTLQVGGETIPFKLIS